MPTVGVRKLREEGSEILRQVREEGVEFNITYHGRLIAHLIPATESEAAQEDMEAVWADMDRLAAEINAKWPTDTSATEAIREDRREL